MLNMTQINHIRDLAKRGYSISEIHELTKTDRKTIAKYLERDDFSPVPPIGQQRPSKVDPFRDKIAEYLEEDKKHWNKQHHTAMRIYERLRDLLHFGSATLGTLIMQQISRIRDIFIHV